MESAAMKSYWAMYDAESVEDRPHAESDQYWRDHMDELEKGFELYNPNCFSPAENVSGVQAILQKRRLIGPDAFDCEYQLQPKKYSFALDLTPADVLGKIGQSKMLAVPENTQMTVASIDLNVSHALICTIVCWDKALTGTVIYHEVFKCRIPSSLPETEYASQVYNLLTTYGRKLRTFGIGNLVIAIDAGGQNWNPVCDWARNSASIKGVELKSCAFAGRASHVWNPNVRSKIRSAIGRTVLCQDEQSGRRWVAWDSDFGKHQVLKGLKAAPLQTGGIMLYDGSIKEHQDFATQVTNEKLLYIQHQSNGKDIYHYKTKSAIDHDYLDTLAQAWAAAQ